MLSLDGAFSWRALVIVILWHLLVRFLFCSLLAKYLYHFPVNAERQYSLKWDCRTDSTRDVSKEMAPKNRQTGTQEEKHSTENRSKHVVNRIFMGQ